MVEPGERIHVIGIAGSGAHSILKSKAPSMPVSSRTGRPSTIVSASANAFMGAVVAMSTRPLLMFIVCERSGCAGDWSLCPPFAAVSA